MTRLEAFRNLMVAEELFEFLGVPYEPRVLQVYRLHVLRRFGLEMDLIDRQQPALDEAARLEAYRQALLRAHELFQRGGSADARAFGPRPEALVPVPRRRG